MLGPSAIVIGIGLNLSLPAQILPRINQPVSSLADLFPGPPPTPVPERNCLFACILSELRSILSGFGEGGFSVLREEWGASSCFP